MHGCMEDYEQPVKTQMRNEAMHPIVVTTELCSRPSVTPGFDSVAYSSGCHA